MLKLESRKAAKPHWCAMCSRRTMPGQRYIHGVLIGRTFEHFDLCNRCGEVVGALEGRTLISYDSLEEMFSEAEAIHRRDLRERDEDWQFEQAKERRRELFGR